MQGALRSGSRVVVGEGSQVDIVYPGSFVMRASAGTDTWRVSVTDPAGEVVLQPDVDVVVDPFVSFHLGAQALSASAPSRVEASRRAVNRR